MSIREQIEMAARGDATSASPFVSLANEWAVEPRLDPLLWGVEVAAPMCRSAALPPAVGRTRRQGPQRHRSLARARPRPQQPAPGSPAAQATAHMGTGGFGVLREHPRMRSMAGVLLPGILIVGGCIASACATSPHGEAAPCNGTRTIVKVRSSRSSGGASTSARCRFRCATRSQRATPSSG